MLNLTTTALSIDYCADCSLHNRNTLNYNLLESPPTNILLTPVQKMSGYAKENLPVASYAICQQDHKDTLG